MDVIIITIKYKITPREVDSLGVLFYSSFLLTIQIFKLSVN